MKYSLRSHNLTLTDLDQEQMDKKLDRIKKHLMPPYVMDVSVTREVLKSEGESVTCIINVEQGKRVFHAERTENTLQNSLDEAIDAISNELKKEHDKKKRHGGGVQK